MYLTEVLFQIYLEKYTVILVDAMMINASLG